MRVSVVILLLSTLLVCYTSGQDDCLDVSVAKNLTSAMIQYSVTQPSTVDAMTTLVQNIYQALTSILSPFAIDIGIGYSNNDFYSVQSCSVSATACAYVTGGYFAEIVNNAMFGDNNPRYFSIDSNGAINISDPVLRDTSTYFPSARPWFNATGWSVQYAFVNLKALSRSYVVQSNGAHIFADRLPTEPCNSCRSRSPAVSLGPFLADSAPLSNWADTTSTASVNAVFNYLLNTLTTWQLGTTITSIGAGFANGDVYFVTDCLATPSAVIECNSSRYVAEVRNSNVYNSDHLFIYAISTSGSLLTSSRDEGSTFNTTGRPWYLQGVGWTDYYTYANAAGGGILARSYAYAFSGGVIEIDSNPASVCYSAPSTTVCPTPTSTPCSAGSRPSLFGLF